MSLPSQEVLDDIKLLITEVTGFEESDENFVICERYCLSHVVHHTYPFVNRSSVKELINSYVSRFYGHGYFQISQELNHQVKEFLSNEKLFEKNPQYDIQWCLLNLLCSLSSELTTVKKIPKLLPVDDEEKETDNFDWTEYLKTDLPQRYDKVLSSDSEHESEESIEQVNNEKEKDDTDVENWVLDDIEYRDSTEKECQNIKKVEIYENKKIYEDEKDIEFRKNKFEEFLRRKNSVVEYGSDDSIKGNISEKFDLLINEEGIVRKSQLLTEHKIMEELLYQFDTGERILLKKGIVSPSLPSLTQDTLCNYIDYLQPYFKVIRNFRDFDLQITEWKYSVISNDKKLNENHQEKNLLCSDKMQGKISNILYIYNVMVKKALEPFQEQITSIVTNLTGNSLLTMERKLESFLFEITYLFKVHEVATRNWKSEPNWMSSLRILSVLYNAIMDAPSSKMSFLFLNLFFHCFQVYLNIIDIWVSSTKLNDPNDEFIVFRSSTFEKDKKGVFDYEIRNYKAELKKSNIKKVELLDFIGEKMIHVGQSLEILQRLNRLVNNQNKSINESSSQSIINLVNLKISSMKINKEKLKEPKRQLKKRSIFTMNNPIFLLENDEGEGEPSSLLKQNLIELKKKEKYIKTDEKNIENVSFKKLAFKNVKNPFFKLAFKHVGIDKTEVPDVTAVRESLELEDIFTVIKGESVKKNGVYPLHKIISESFYHVFGHQISDACSLVKNIVISECHLLSHLSLLRSVLLFNDAYLIQSFMLAIFTQPVIWDSPYSLSLHLRECVRNLYKDQANALSVTFNKGNRVLFNNVLEVIDAISINYEVKWPLNLILTPEVMEKYNSIFRLALKLKWAHWVLSGLHSQWDDELQSELPKSSRHRMQLLRFWFLSASGVINSYFMTQMLPWELDLTSSSDLNDIIKVHSAFIDKVYYNCLLSNKCPKGRDLIFQTFIPLCKDLSLMGSVIPIQKLSVIENTFGNCQLQIYRLMSSLEKE